MTLFTFYVIVGAGGLISYLLQRHKLKVYHLETQGHMSWDWSDFWIVSLLAVLAVLLWPLAAVVKAADKVREEL